MQLTRRQWVALTGGAASLGPAIVFGQPKAPLLIDGKKTLYQRVLTRPGAIVSAKAGAVGTGKAAAPFTVFFVYERVTEGGAAWLLVGSGTQGKTDGYLKETDTVPWAHSITLAFAAPTNRERVLFFREKAGLSAMINADNAVTETQRVAKEITAKGTLGAGHAVIAAEPEKYIDLQKQFYLLPVLEASSTLLKSGHRTRLVRVASITQDAQPAAPAPAAPAAGDAGISNFNSAVVFVIDATSSMQPYIDRTRKAMEEVLKQAEEGKVQNRIRFGLLGFQDDPAKTQGVEYLSKIFADPNQTTTKEQFMAAMQKIQATKSSTRAFAEDGYSALDEALRKINWNNFGGRYIVYITDASAREGNSSLASTKMSTDQMRTNAQERGVAIYAMHIKTPEGQKDHAIAEAQFKRLSAWPGKGALYFPVEAGDPTKFEGDVKKMARALVEQVKSPEKTLAMPTAGKGDAVQDSVDAVGRAMVLSYLGRQQGVKSPPMYEAWASDRDVKNREIPAFTVRVLLTKNQLSDLQNTLRRLIEAGEKAQIDPGSFFNQLRSAAVAMGRDPSRLAQGQAKNLEQSGLMGDYLEGLPYQSQLMSIDLDAWTNMGVGQSQAILDTIKSKVALYQRFHDDVDRWVKLNPASNDGDRVYPVPIDSLP